MKSVDVSIVMPFRDHEHLVGRTSRQIAEYCAEQGLVFEIIAVDEGSGDNSHAVLALLRQEIPGIRVVMGKGHAAGSATAQGRVLVLANLESIVDELTPALEGAIGQVGTGEFDMQLVAEHLLVCNRAQTLEVVANGPARRQLSARMLLHRGRTRGLKVQSYRPERHGLADSSLARMLAAIMPGAASSNRAL